MITAVEAAINEAMIRKKKNTLPMERFPTCEKRIYDKYCEYYAIHEYSDQYYESVSIYRQPAPHTGLKAQLTVSHRCNPRALKNEQLFCASGGSRD